MATISVWVMVGFLWAVGHGIDMDVCLTGGGEVRVRGGACSGEMCRIVSLCVTVYEIGLGRVKWEMCGCRSEGGVDRSDEINSSVGRGG
jgi:hypothetical protein